MIDTKIKYVYIQGMHRAEVVSRGKDYWKVVPLEHYKYLKSINRRLKKRDCVFTFDKRLIKLKENEKRNK